MDSVIPKISVFPSQVTDFTDSTMPKPVAERRAAGEGPEDQPSLLGSAKGHAWQLMIQAGLLCNGLCTCGYLLAALGGRDGGCGFVWVTLPSAASCLLCAAYLLHDRRRRRVTLQDEFSPRRPRYRLAAYAAMMIVTVACSCVHPCALRSPSSAMNRLLFSVATLCPVEAALFNFAASVARTASWCYHHGELDVQGGLSDFLFAEFCILLGVVLATYAIREVCDSLAAEPVVLDLDAAEGGGPKMPTAFEPEAECIALSSIIAASCDAVVFVDLMLTILKPAPTLAAMLGFAGTMCGETLPMLPPHQDEETEKFLESLARLRPSSTPEAAAQLPVSLISASDGLVRVRCSFASCSSSGGKAVRGYLLGISEINPYAEADLRAKASLGSKSTRYVTEPSTSSGNRNSSDSTGRAYRSESLPFKDLKGAKPHSVRTGTTRAGWAGSRSGTSRPSPSSPRASPRDYREWLAGRTSGGSQAPLVPTNSWSRPRAQALGNLSHSAIAVRETSRSSSIPASTRIASYRAHSQRGMSLSEVIESTAKSLVLEDPPAWEIQSGRSLSEVMEDIIATFASLEEPALSLQTPF